MRFTLLRIIDKLQIVKLHFFVDTLYILTIKIFFI